MIGTLVLASLLAFGGAWVVARVLGALVLRLVAGVRG